MKDIEIIPLAKRKMKKRRIPEAWVGEALGTPTKLSQDLAVVRRRSSGAEFASGKCSSGLFSRRPRINMW